MTKAKTVGRVTHTHTHLMFTKIINKIEIKKAMKIAFLNIDKTAVLPVIDTG